MSEKLQTIIVEDEELARNLMKSFLKDNDKIDIVAECENGFEGVKMINELKPDLVFLDIQMPKITGFELLELLDHKPQIIFATAYDQYAIKAFEYHAADYLLKPYSKERLLEVVKIAWASYFTAKEIQHRIKNKQGDVLPALIVFNMFDCDYCGESYSYNINNDDKAQILVKAKLGCPSGFEQEDPEMDEYVVGREESNLISQILSAKE